MNKKGLFNRCTRYAVPELSVKYKSKIELCLEDLITAREAKEVMEVNAGEKRKGQPG